MSEMTIVAMAAVILICVMCWISFFRMRDLAHRVERVEQDYDELFEALTKPDGQQEAVEEDVPSTTNNLNLQGLFNGPQNKRK